MGTETFRIIAVDAEGQCLPFDQEYLQAHSRNARTVRALNRMVGALRDLRRVRESKLPESAMDGCPSCRHAATSLFEFASCLVGGGLEEDLRFLEGVVAKRA